MTDLDVFLIEDNHGDVRMVEQAFERRDLQSTLTVAKTGTAALDRLQQRGESADATRPDLVLLDLNLPATDGGAVLERIKSDPDLRRIPVVVLTSSKSETDLNEAYDQHANACLSKPVDPDEFADRIETTVNFWGAAVTLPSAPEDGRDRHQ